MSTGSKVRTGKEVIEALLSADTPAKKAKATKLKNEYVWTLDAAAAAAAGIDPQFVAVREG